MTIGLGDFSPGVDSMRAAGIAVTRAPYDTGAAGIRASLETMAQKMREGRNDAAVMGWARHILKNKGLDGRDRPTVKQQVGALLDELRAATIYAPDPYGTEMISSASATLCLRPGLCIGGGDCFPQGTLLLRDDYKLVPIEQIAPGSKIWGLDKWTLVEAVAFKGKLAVDAIEMNNGSTMALTGGHKVFIGRCRHGRTAECPTCFSKDRCETFERALVSDLVEGTPLLQPDRINFGFGEMDLGWAYIQGLYISDGWSEEGRFSISGLDGHRKEAQKHEVKAICERLEVKTHWHKKHIRISDPEWATRLAALGTRARFKHIETLNLNEATAAEMLRGVMADSTANTNGPGRTFSTTSRELMVQMRVLHRMFGSSTGLKMLTPEQHGGAGKHPLWRLGVRVGDSKTLMVKSIDRAVRRVPCWDVQTADHYVYLPEHDVTVSNCDDLSVALGSATLSLGIPTQIVKQNFGADQQEHVLIAVQDESGEWLYADPSTRMPLGSALHAKSEVWVDPMDPIGTLPEATPELVTLGALPSRQVARIDGAWWEHRYGQWWRHDGSGWKGGLGAPVGFAAVTPFQNVADKTVIKGLRYRVGFLINVIAQPGDTPPDNATIKAALLSKFANDWLLESLDPSPGVTGGVQSWILQGIALNNQTLQDDPPGVMSVSYQTVGVQASAPAVVPDAPIVAVPVAPTPAVSVGAVVAATAAIAVGGGLLWHHFRKRPRR